MWRDRGVLHTNNSGPCRYMVSYQANYILLYIVFIILYTSLMFPLDLYISPLSLTPLQCIVWHSARPSQRWSRRQKSGRLSWAASSSFWASPAWWSGGRKSTVNLPVKSDDDNGSGCFCLNITDLVLLCSTWCRPFSQQTRKSTAVANNINEALFLLSIPVSQHSQYQGPGFI